MNRKSWLFAFVLCIGVAAFASNDLPTPCGDHSVPYNLNTGKEAFSISSPIWLGRVYFIQPCAAINPNHPTSNQSISNQSCPFPNQQICFTESVHFWNNQSIPASPGGLGSPESAHWSPRSYDWNNGAINIHTAFAPYRFQSDKHSTNQSSNQTTNSSVSSLTNEYPLSDWIIDNSICNFNRYDLPRNQSESQSNNDTLVKLSMSSLFWSVTIEYLCINGSNQVQLIREPRNPFDFCNWHFLIDSSAVCSSSHSIPPSTNHKSDDESSDLFVWLTLIGPIICILIVLIIVMIFYRQYVRNQSINQSIDEQIDQLRQLENQSMNQINESLLNSSPLRNLQDRSVNLTVD